MHKMGSSAHSSKEEKKICGKDAFAYLPLILYFGSFNDKWKIVLIDSCEI